MKKCYNIFQQGVLRLFLLALLFFSSANAYLHGGNVSGFPTVAAGDVFSLINGGSFSAASNTVNVDTLRIIRVTTNVKTLAPGGSASVTINVRNTGAAAVTPVNINLRIYKNSFYNISTLPPIGDNPDTWPPNRIDNVPGAFVIVQNPLTPIAAIPAGGSISINFTVTVTNVAALFNTIAANPVILDGYTDILLPNSYNDHWWTVNGIYTGAVNGAYQYASDVTANWDMSGPPFVTSIVVAPNPAPKGLTRITVNFSEAMNIAQQPSINYRFGGVTYNISGNWANNTTWAGTFNITLSNVQGLATVSALRATDNTGVAMIPSFNVGHFTIDTLKPTASLQMAVTYNAAATVTVNFIATDRLGVTPSLQLRVSLNNLTAVNIPVNFTANIGRVTWNGTLVIPVNALINSVATFNLIGNYVDMAGNTNNALVGRITVNIGAALPAIATVNFDSVRAYNGLVISAEPYIEVYIIDWAQKGISPASVRVTVDGALILSGPIAITQLSTNVYRYTFNYPGKLSQGQHTFTFGISDLSGTPGIPYTVQVEVVATSLDIRRGPIPFPNPFSPNGDGINDTTEIVYELTQSAEINIYIYNLNGDIVWKQDIAKGLEGAHAGINRVPWNGQATFGRGDVLPNGIYICHIIADVDGEKRSLGRTKIMILN